MDSKDEDSSSMGKGVDTDMYAEEMAGDDAPISITQFDDSIAKSKNADNIMETMFDGDAPMPHSHVDVAASSKAKRFGLEHITSDANEAPIPPQYLEGTIDRNDSRKKVIPTHREGPAPSAPRVSQLPPSSSVRDDSNSEQGTTDNIEVLEATLVQEPPLYNAVQVEEQREQESAQPPSESSNQDQTWWKKHGRCVFVGLVFIIGGMAGIIGVLFATQGRNDDVSSSFEEPKGSLKPTGSPVIQPPTSWKPTTKPTLKPVTPLPTAEVPDTNPPSKESTNKPTADTSCGSYVYRLLSPGECDNCKPRVDIDGANALVTSGTTNIMMMTHADNGNFGRVAEWNDVVAKNKGAVAISGDIFAVGFAGSCGGCAGLVYTYEKNEAGGWDKSNSYIRPPDAHENNIFEESLFASNVGTSVDLDGNVMIVGATGQDAGRGAAYLYFRRAKNSWRYGAKIKPSGYRADLGRSVSIKADSAAVLVAIGDPRFGENAYEMAVGNDNAQRGAVFIQSYNITAGAILSEHGISVTRGNDCKRWFGQSVELTKDRDLFVGCPHDDNNSGAAYFYEQSDYKNGEYNSAPKKILPSDGGFDSDQFGRDIAEDDGVVAIGTYAQTRGKVYVYARIDGEWSEVAIINAPDGEQFFGESLALSGNTLVVSSRDNAFSYSLASCRS